MNAAFHHWWDERRQRREAAALDRRLRLHYPRWHAEVGQGGAEAPPNGITEPVRGQPMRLPGRGDWER